MLKIGMDKTDRSFRKFEYDDERMYGNPKVFKVLYEETGVFGEVLSSNVISIRKSNSTHNHFLDIPVYNTTKVEAASKPVAVSEPLVVSVKPVESSTATEEKKKGKSTKSKAKTKEPVAILKPATEEEIRTPEADIKLDITSILPKSYEYDVLVVDNISYVEDVKTKLNELGKDGWDVCGFQIVQKIFGGGAQAIIIMKKGLN
jgi:hypothetical protein